MSDELEAAAADILEGSEPIDLDHRRASWRQEGWADYQAAAPASAAYGEGSGLAEVGTTVSAEGALAGTGPGYGEAATRPAMESRDRIPGSGDEEVIQAAEEQLRVGKREVGRGGVRVRSYVTERPVEEQVELRQERVTVERRPVDRELAPGEACVPGAHDRGGRARRGGGGLEDGAGDRGDRPAQGRRARTETVRDTVRKQEVEVEDERGARKPTGTGTVVEGDMVDPELAGTSR